MQFSNEGLTTGTGGFRGLLPAANQAGPRRIQAASRCGDWPEARSGCGRVGRHEDGKAKPGQVMQRLVDADQRPEPGMLLVDAEGRGGEAFGAVDCDMDGEIDKS